MSYWFRRPLRFPTLQAVTIALHCPQTRLHGLVAPGPENSPPKRFYLTKFLLPPSSATRLLPQWSWDYSQVTSEHRYTIILLGAYKRHPWNHLICCVTLVMKILFWEPPTYFMALCGSYLDISRNLLANALTRTALKHISQLPVNLNCTETIAHWEAVPPFSVNIFPSSVTILLSKLIYSSTKVIIFLNWYKYWINKINQMHSPENLS